MKMEQLPDPETLNQLFGDLLDLKTEVFKGKPVPLKAGDDPVVVASYITGEEKVKCLCLCDISAANRMGSALTMIPVDIANKSINDHTISDDIIDNIREIMNIVTTFLNVPELPHFKLKEVLSSKQELPEEITALAGDPGLRLDLEINLQNYGQGYMSILLDEVDAA